jgi:hypothetical protein
MKTDAMKNVRVAYHIKVIRRAEQQTAVSPASAVRDERRPPPTPSGGGAVSIFELFQSLNPAMRARVAMRAREEGITNIARVTGDQEFILLRLIQAEQPTEEERF